MSLGSAAVAETAAPEPAVTPTGYPPGTYPPGTYPTAAYPPAPAYQLVPVIAAQPEHPQRSFSLTFSPIHLLIPMLELTGEVKIQDRFSVAFIGGIGRYSQTDSGVNLSATAYEAGGHLRFYPIGDFRRGLELGVEVLYLKLSDTNLAASGEGLAVGPFIGYKITTDAGFTFDVQGGAERVFERATATSYGSTSTATQSAYIPLLNLNIGWSF
jgi:hypothetical protein